MPDKTQAISVYYDNDTLSASEIVSPFRGAIRSLFLLSFFINALSVALPLALMLAIDGRIGVGFGGAGRTGLLALAFLLSFNFLLRHIRASGIEKILASIDNKICRIIFEKILRIPNKRGANMESFFSSVFSDIDAVRSGLAGARIASAFEFPFALLYVGAAGVLFGRAFFIPLALAVIYIAFAAGCIYALASADEGESMAAKERDDLVSSTIHNISSIKTMNLSAKVGRMWEDYQAALSEASHRRGRVLDGVLSANFALYFSGLAVLCVAGASVAARGGMSLGAVLASLLLFSHMFFIVNDFIKYLPEQFRFSNSLLRLSQVMGQKTDAMKTLVVEDITQGDLRLEKAEILDSLGEKIITGASFTFEPGMAYVVKAKSSFEASAFLKSLFGGYPFSSGRAMFDRYDVAEIASSSLKDHIRFAGENPFAIDGTVRENLACFVSGGSHEREFSGFISPEAAVEMLGLADVIAGLPNGYDTMLASARNPMGEEGLKLLSLARAFVGNPRVLVFDQPLIGLSRAHAAAFSAAVKNAALERIVIISSAENLAIPKVAVDISGGRVEVAPDDGGEEEGGMRAQFRRIFGRKN
ncbi:MAG: hypothetical protein LBL52_01365 [Rickettsiales bacterium]|jgi:ABC-type protease/lipase transport system fused ATPase/permease subunit|nr:hypothetical protein [Rickettsiales bacterium]